MASLFSKAFDFLYIKAGKDSNFKLKTEQNQRYTISSVFRFFNQP